MACKGICIRHKAQKPVGSGRYAAGQKRCQVCEIFLNWIGLWCPCCGYRLRGTPRNFKYKNRLREQKMMKDDKKDTHQYWCVLTIPSMCKIPVFRISNADIYLAELMTAS